MMKPLSSVDLSEKLILLTYPTNADHHGPYWLYDKTKEMNIVIGADTEREAFVKALTYYQKRLKEIEVNYYLLKEETVKFVDRLIKDGFIERE